MHPSSFNRRRTLKTLFCSSAALALNVRQTRAADTEKGALHHLAIGDFGTTGVDQKAVSEAMQTFLQQKQIQAESLLLLGDNFYSEVKGGFSVDSERWITGFEDMYPTRSFPGPCPAVLGNHDYYDNIGGAEVQLEYAKKPGTRWTLPDRWYRYELGGAEPLVTVLAVDTNFPNVTGGYDGKKKRERPSLSAAQVVEQTAWLKAQLEGPRAPMTLMIGHHPFYSNGSHLDTQPVIDAWGELIQKHQVHAYLCGHDHDLQHLELEGLFTSFVISGGGGAKTRPLKSPERKMPFGRDVHGFTHIQILPQRLIFAHHGVDGSLLHRFTKHADGRVEIG
ncbi:MAG: metallophosphoesterase [Verrucomicrobiales bacterium]|nr:metallophosphoesterase [Verrucomicrobiales bacterium]